MLEFLGKIGRDCCLGRGVAASRKFTPSLVSTTVQSAFSQAGAVYSPRRAATPTKPTGIKERTMKRLIVATLLLGLSSAAAVAQTTNPPAPTPTPAPAASTAAPASDAKPSAKEARAKCNADAKAQGLKGEDRKTAVADCFAKARPDLAAADKCRQEGKDKKLAGKELKTYVKQCVPSAQ
jgi:hypothetical protein